MTWRDDVPVEIEDAVNILERRGYQPEVHTTPWFGAYARKDGHWIEVEEVQLGWATTSRRDEHHRHEEGNAALARDKVRAWAGDDS